MLETIIEGPCLTSGTYGSRDPVLRFCGAGIRKTEARTGEISVGGRRERAHPGFVGVALQPSLGNVAVVPSAR